MGDYTYKSDKLNLDDYIYNLNSNVQGFLDSKNAWSEKLKLQFREAFDKLSNGLTDLNKNSTDRFSTTKYGELLDLDGSFSGSGQYYDKDGQNISDEDYNKLSDEDKRKYYNSYRDVVSYSNLIASELLKSGKKKAEPKKTTDPFDFSKHGAAAWFNRTINPSNDKMDASWFLNMDPADSSGNRGITGRSTWLANQLEDYLKNNPEYEGLDWTNSSYKNYDNYKQFVTKQIEDLRKGIVNHIDLNKLGFGSDFQKTFFATSDQLDTSDDSGIEQLDDSNDNLEKQRTEFNNSKYANVRKIQYSNWGLIKQKIYKNKQWLAFKKYTNYNDAHLNFFDRNVNGELKNKYIPYYISTLLHTPWDLFDGAVKRVTDNKKSYILLPDLQASRLHAALVFDDTNGTLEYKFIGDLFNVALNNKEGGIILKYLGGSNIDYNKIILDNIAKEEYDTRPERYENMTLEEYEKTQSTDFEAADWIDLGSSLVDLASGVVSFVGGNVAAGITGAVGSIGHLTADISRDGFLWSDLGNFGKNLALDAIGIIPGGGTTKMAKAANTVLKLGVAGVGILGAKGLIKDMPACMESVKKLSSGNFSDLTKEDVQNFVKIGLAALLAGGAVKMVKQSRNFIKARNLAGNGKVVQLTDSNGNQKNVLFTGGDWMNNLENWKTVEQLNKGLSENPATKEFGFTAEATKLNNPWKFWEPADGYRTQNVIRRTYDKYGNIDTDKIVSSNGQWLINPRNWWQPDRVVDLVIGENDKLSEKNFNKYPETIKTDLEKANVKFKEIKDKRDAYFAPSDVDAITKALLDLITNNGGIDVVAKQVRDWNVAQNTLKNLQDQLSSLNDLLSDLLAQLKKLPKKNRSSLNPDINAKRNEITNLLQKLSQAHQDVANKAIDTDVYEAFNKYNDNVRAYNRIMDENNRLNKRKNRASKKDKKNYIPYNEIKNGYIDIYKRDNGSVYRMPWNLFLEEGLRRDKSTLSVSNFKLGGTLLNRVRKARFGMDTEELLDTEVVDPVTTDDKVTPFKGYDEYYKAHQNQAQATIKGNRYHNLDPSKLNTDLLGKLNEAYTKSGQITSDIQNYFNSAGITDLQGFVKKYNENIKSLSDYSNDAKRFAGETGAKGFNLLFKSMYASRSSAEDNDYNLGYSDADEDIYGSTSYLRRVDTYGEAFNGQKDRIHKIDLGDGKYGYVYKKEDGTIDLLDENDALNYLQANKTVTPGSDDNNNSDEVVKNSLPKKWKGVLSKIDPNRILQYGLLTSANHRMTKIKLNAETPYLQNPDEKTRTILSNLPAETQGLNTAGRYNHLASQSISSDPDLQQSTMLEAARMGLDAITQGYAASDQALRDSAEKSWQNDKEYLTKRTAMANENRLSTILTLKNKADIKASEISQKANDLKNLMNEFDYNRKKDKEKADQFVLANIKQSVNNNIKNYVQGATDEDVTLWNDYIKGVKKYSEFSTEERSRLVQIQNEVETAIQNETLKYLKIYTDYDQQPILTKKKEEFVPTIKIPTRKDGGQVEIAKLKAKVSNADRVFKTVLKTLDRHEKILERISKSLYGLPQIEVIK